MVQPVGPQTTLDREQGWHWVAARVLSSVWSVLN